MQRVKKKVTSTHQRGEDKMTLRQFIKDYIRPHVKDNDKPYNRELFSDTKDILHKDGMITDKQVQNWIYPNTKLFV